MRCGRCAGGAKCDFCVEGKVDIAKVLSKSEQKGAPSSVPPVKHRVWLIQHERLDVVRAKRAAAQHVVHM